MATTLGGWSHWSTVMKQRGINAGTQLISSISPFYSTRNHNKWDGGVHTWCRSSLFNYISAETLSQAHTRVHLPVDFRYCKVNHHNTTPCQLDTLFSRNLPTLVLKVRGHLIIKDAFSPSLSVPKLLIVLKIFFKKSKFLLESRQSFNCESSYSF